MSDRLALLICGSRGWDDPGPVHDVFERVLDRYSCLCVTVIHGGARGADSMADRMAAARGFEVIRMDADWSLGRRAGYLRNRAMVEALLAYRAGGADVAVVAFSLGTPGTQHTINIARAADLPVEVHGRESLSPLVG